MAAMSSDCLFCKIVAGEIESTVVYQTDRVLAFRDLSPQAPTHVLVIPKDHHQDAAALGAADPELAGQVLAAAAEVAKVDGVDSSGYRLVFNTGKDANQTVQHAHLHVLGGRGLEWPPG